MDATQETTALRATPPSAWQRALLRGGRQGARSIGQLLLPSSVVVWRQPRALTQGARSKVALTFDDGPTSLTRDYLAVLERFGARATFFVIGQECLRYPELVRAIADAGHELAGHGFTHRRFTQLRPSILVDELLATRRLLPWDRTKPSFVRPPHGAVSLSSTLTSLRAGFTTVLWSHNSGDWATERAEDVARAFEKPISAGEIVLLHEGQRWTLEALPDVLTNLSEAGHDLVTMGELLGR